MCWQILIVSLQFVLMLVETWVRLCNKISKKIELVSWSRRWIVWWRKLWDRLVFLPSLFMSESRISRMLGVSRVSFSEKMRLDRCTIHNGWSSSLHLFFFNQLWARDLIVTGVWCQNYTPFHWPCCARVCIKFWFRMASSHSMNQISVNWLVHYTHYSQCCPSNPWMWHNYWLNWSWLHKLTSANGCWAE